MNNSSWRAEFRARVATSSARKVAAASVGSVTARIQIRAIGVDQFVVEGTATADLEKGPGHYAGTAVPGQAGNVAIAGHRTTFGEPFRRLDELHRGEPITLTTITGQKLTYVVSRPPVAVSPSDNAILGDYGDDRLTLSTSDPRYTATDRLVVVALLSAGPSSGVAVPTHRAGGPPGRLADTKTAGWNPNRLPAVGVVALVLILLGLAYRRAAPVLRRVVTVVLFIPLWAAGIYLLFLALTYFLPTTV